MGFPIPYAGVLPKILLTAASSMASIREICTSILRTMGISIPDDQSQDQDYSHNHHHHYYYHQDHQYNNREAGPWLYMTASASMAPSASSIGAIQASLPSVSYETLETAQKQGDPSKLQQQQCAVCLSEIGKGQQVRALPRCSHIFHTNCIDAWLSHSHRTCPLCRTSLVTDEVAMMEAQEVSDQLAASWLIYQEEDDADDLHGRDNVQNLNHFHNFYSSQNFN